MRFIYYLLLFPIFYFSDFNVSGQIPIDPYFPDQEEWLQYNSPDDVGYSKEKIDSIRNYFDSIQAHSLLLLYQGKVVVNWGDNTRRMRCASIRKSLLSALYGIAIEEGKIDLDQSIGMLKAASMGGLDSIEKSASIRNLLTATSGIYLPAAYEPEVWTKGKPKRGSHRPGEKWYYNNWDFNTLGAIYDQISEDSIARDFQKKIAIPIGMEDFRPALDFKYFFEGDIEIPAYLFKMSTRDLARFGLLYLHNGSWGEKQLISSIWIEESTQHLKTPWEDTGYGYLWWNTRLNDKSYVYYASGTGEQDVFVVPSRDLVLVFRADTYLGPEVRTGEGLKILQMLTDAQSINRIKKKSVCSPVKWHENQYTGTSIDISHWLGSYSNNIARQIKIEKQGKQYIIETKIADFLLIPQTDSTAWVEDLNVMAHLRKSGLKPASSFFDRDKLLIYR